MTTICSTCRFFMPANPAATFGFCKSAPPVFTHICPERDLPKFHNPVVSPHNWCGDHESEEG